jgi:uncharacterized MAPEG superfamily protein|tara:strand:- start:558 stop:1088 length:531 start_codon:yes stop_codon:yes gene_type:complete
MVGWAWPGGHVDQQSIPILSTAIFFIVLITELVTRTPAAPYAFSLVFAGAVVITSIIPLGAARSQADFTLDDMKAPRAMFDRLPAWGKRASWAHQNSFEAFSLHAPAALLALIAVSQTGELQGLAIPAALLQPVLRLLYLPAYIANIAPLRGLCWASALLCTGILYLEGAKALALA